MPVINRIAAFHDDMTAWRHDLHQHPELAFQEVRTSALVAEKLRAFGLDEVHTGMAKTAVVGVLHGRGGAGGPTIGLRADMDALPMEELGNPDYKSRNPGRMHACGHDGHTTMLLGAARYLAENRNFHGTVHFLFQPAEEYGGGAEVMVKEGLFDRFPCDQVYALHNWPELPEGQIAVRPGPMMAAADEFTVTITGKGGHAAMPHLAIDPIPAALQIVQAYQGLVARQVDPLDQVVISVTQVHTGSANNVIPESAVVSGTLRTFNKDTQTRMIERMRALAEGIAAAHGCRARYEFDWGYPATLNDPHKAVVAAQVAADVVGQDKVLTEVNPCMGGEDFSYMLEQRPGAYLWLGQRRGPEEAMVHNPYYDFNDQLLPIGASLFARFVETLLPADAASAR